MRFLFFIFFVVLRLTAAPQTYEALSLPLEVQRNHCRKLQDEPKVSVVLKKQCAVFEKAIAEAFSLGEALDTQMTKDKKQMKAYLGRLRFAKKLGARVSQTAFVQKSNAVKNGDVDYFELLIKDENLVLTKKDIAFMQKQGDRFASHPKYKEHKGASKSQEPVPIRKVKAKQAVKRRVVKNAFGTVSSFLASDTEKVKRMLEDCRVLQATRVSPALQTLCRQFSDKAVVFIPLQEEYEQVSKKVWTSFDKALDKKYERVRDRYYDQGRSIQTIINTMHTTFQKERANAISTDDVAYYKILRKYGTAFRSRTAQQFQSTPTAHGPAFSVSEYAKKCSEQALLERRLRKRSPILYNGVPASRFYPVICDCQAAGYADLSPRTQKELSTILRIHPMSSNTSIERTYVEEHRTYSKVYMKCYAETEKKFNVVPIQKR